MFGSQVINQHHSKGRYFKAQDVQSFVLEEGEGMPVVCMHGVPASSFLYRKVLPELASKNFKGVAFDLPGLGLADRPQTFDYSFTGLGAWSANAVDALEIDQYHLVVHDIGGPVGFELLMRHHDRIQSLTILNTLLAKVEGFKKPWSMRPFGQPGLGPLWLASLNRFSLAFLMYLQGVQNRKELPLEHVLAYVKLLKGTDRGQAFLRIMRSFETTAEKQRAYLEAVRALNKPKQIIWGRNDPALKIGVHGYPAAEATGIERFIEMPGKHFLQEDCYRDIASAIEQLIR